MRENQDWIERKTGVDLDTRCFECGINAEESFNKGAVNTGINHPEYKTTYSFYHYGKNQDVCPRCHKELELGKLFAVMDARDK